MSISIDDRINWAVSFPWETWLHTACQQCAFTFPFLIITVAGHSCSRDLAKGTAKPTLFQQQLPMCPAFPCVVTFFGEMMHNPCSSFIISIELAERKNEIILQQFSQILLFILIPSYFFLNSICTPGNCFGRFIDRQGQATLPQIQSTVCNSNKLQKGKIIMDLCASSLEDIFSGWDFSPLFLDVNIS